ncbi:response regulator [Asticcacaulis sp. AC402]|uniref:response regulator n=1 Tax=Asticcacaulis sp. AC402 TaxID=1282361 RepID=UPI0003C3FA3D|nr:response regulator [Asticcacaulis sp. AC402]ESQ77119.1 hypothetical protein ABAC402_01605 [Asticcacaulis sp. AC402]
MPIQVTQTVNLAPLHMLIVDDNRHMCTILGAVLKSVGVSRLRQARDGAEALDLMRQYPIDMAIVDYNMTPVDGIEFTLMQRRAADSMNPYLPIIMVSGHSERSRIVAARDAGVNEFLVKPLNAKALLDRVVNVVMRARPYIKCVGYFGPDRRRRSDSQYAGPYRRTSDGFI